VKVMSVEPKEKIKLLYGRRTGMFHECMTYSPGRVCLVSFSENASLSSTRCLEKGEWVHGRSKVCGRQLVKGRLLSGKWPYHSLSSAVQLMNKAGYAGPRFSEAPSPKVLPLPPSHWLANIPQPSADSREMTQLLKGILRVA
jgi:Proline-rich nuclear receptor coactivator motif